MTVPVTSGSVNAAADHAATEVAAPRGSGGALVEFRDLRRSFGATPRTRRTHSHPRTR